MWSTRLDRLRHTVAFRLTAWYAVVFGVGTLLLFGLCYHLLGVGLKAQEREGIETKLVELAGEYEAGGLPAVIRDAELSSEVVEGPPFVVRVADGNNHTRFQSPKALWGGFDPDHLGDSPPVPGTWFEAGKRERILQMASVRLPGGNYLQVGRSAVRLDRALERFREIFGSVVVPLLFCSVGVGWFLARRALAPVRSITRALEATEGGDLSRRVPSPDSDDELEVLARQYNRLLDRIETLVAAMRQSLDNVAHDLRTPITRLRGMAEVALSAESDPALLREALADCVEEADRITGMLKACMDISEAETGVLELHRQPCNLAQIASQVMDLFGLLAEEQGLTVALDIPDTVVVDADPARLRQVLANLVDNALKYTPRGGRMELRAALRGASCQLQITDTGIGIAPEDQPRIWDRLYRADHSRTRKGLGLGLSLVRAVVMAHGGQVAVESAPGQGSTFTVHLPLAAGRDVPAEDVG